MTQLFFSVDMYYIIVQLRNKYHSRSGCVNNLVLTVDLAFIHVNLWYFVALSGGDDPSFYLSEIVCRRSWREGAFPTAVYRLFFYGQEGVTIGCDSFFTVRRLHRMSPFRKIGSTFSRKYEKHRYSLLHGGCDANRCHTMDYTRR